MRIGLVSIYVNDQDKAERFYTQVLGLQSRPAPPMAPPSAG
jgi:catechol 2,3-dioxygenase-like lactoylglutathione lyase family enzyme